MMPKVERVIAAARGCIGTPFHHQGRVPLVGLDCIGLVIVALRAAGLEVQDRTDYGRLPAPDALRHALAAHGAVPTDALAAGDVLLFAIIGLPSHVALCSEAGRMIHAYAPMGRVVETQLDSGWRRRLAGLYRFPDLER